MTQDGTGQEAASAVITIPAHDPLSVLLIARAAPVALTGLALESPALDALRAAGIVLVVPLVADGRLLGSINLGPRRSEQEYSSDDRSLLATLASQLAPAVQLANLVHRQEEQAAERERIDQELRVARVIQQTLLPTDLPDLAPWQVDAFYRPAREVGGDFYDVIPLANGRVVLVEGDVTDKGVPAALVMATCRAALRAAVERSDDPGEVLRLTNDALVGAIPATMFVTCFCAVFDRAGSALSFANAGHPLPILVTEDASRTVRATGMPLGMLPGSRYDVVEVTVPAGGMLVIASDGVAEAHGHDGSMYGFDRVRQVVLGAADPARAIVNDVDGFSPGTQEDDITVVVLRRAGAPAETPAEGAGRRLIAFDLPSREGVERGAMERVVEVATVAGMQPARARRLGTAVAEAVMNAAEHAHGFDEGKRVAVTVDDAGAELVVAVSDEGVWEDVEVVAPDIEAKVAGEQSPRGWGRFLMAKLTDGLRDGVVDGRHVLSITMRKVDEEDT